MRKFVSIAILVLLAAALSGCMQIAMGRAEIDKLFIIRVFSFDETESGKIRITVTTKNLSKGAVEGEVMQNGESIVSEGDTVFEAIRNMSTYSDRKINGGHTEYILFGEPLAKKGILPYLDFISRHPEFRYNAKLYVIKGDTANSFVERANTSKYFVGDRLAHIEENIGRMSISSIISLNEALMILDEKNLDTFIPYIEPIPTRTTGEEPDTYDILLGGYGIFREDQLTYFASREESRGINWMMNRISSGVIVVKDRTGQEVTMVIIKGTSKIIPRIEGDELHCLVKISLVTNIGEIMGEGNVLDKASLNYLTEQQENAVKREVENAIKTAQEKNSDHFSIISKFRIKYPLMGDYFRQNWQKIFPDIKFDVSVDSKIDGAYMINEPTGASKEAVGE
ncbi:MAG: Ger(x)C family spore germination protein [Clostridiaceae bacterium]|jgi:spore germination protein KC|nr:Ger(x)C family spore germination protein [Clostridiaceae bacterium]